MQAIELRTDVPQLASALPAKSAQRPQATHRELVQDDYAYGFDMRIETKVVARTHAWRKVAATPKLPTIYEMPKLRCIRCELADPRMPETVKFSAIYCPRAYGMSVFEGLPLVSQDEDLENFVVLGNFKTSYINVTSTMHVVRLQELRAYALGLFREAFTNGRLR